VLICGIISNSGNEEDPLKAEEMFVTTEDGLEFAKKLGPTATFIEVEESELANAIKSWVSEMDGKLFRKVEDLVTKSQHTKVEPEPILNVQAVAPLKNLSWALNSQQFADIVFTFAEFDSTNQSQALDQPFDLQNFDVHDSPLLIRNASSTILFFTAK